MRFIANILLFFILANTLLVADKIDATMDGRALVVRVKEVIANCASKFDDKIEINGKKITITQIDTSTSKQRCECSYDLIHTIGNLSGGKYKIDIFREEYKNFGASEDKKFLVGSIEFEIPNLGQKSGITLDFRQTPCKSSSKVSLPAVPKNIALEIFPNPGKDEITIRFNSSSKNTAKFSIYNLIGKEILSREFKSLDDGVYVGKINLQGIPEGIYIAKIVIDNINSETKKLIWSK